MKEIVGDIWKFWERGHWIVVTTNCNTRHNGEAIMGKGLALTAAQRFTDLPRWLGQRIAVNRQVYNGNAGVLNPFPDIRIFCFPTKWNWWDKSDLHLIAVCTSQLPEYIENAYITVKTPVYLPRVGCGNGKLDWEKDVKPILEKYLDDRFVVVERP